MSWHLRPGKGISDSYPHLQDVSAEIIVDDLGYLELRQPKILQRTNKKTENLTSKSNIRTNVKCKKQSNVRVEQACWILEKQQSHHE